MENLLGLDTLIAQVVLALGLALLAGNGWAWMQHRRGKRPAGAQGEFRRNRVLFLLIVGVVLAVWGLASLL
ncbi:MAG: hypothetical protein ACE5MI_00575 [Acidimicrobiia bacterium]